jgi:hypothetical protein
LQNGKERERGNNIHISLSGSLENDNNQGKDIARYKFITSELKQIK